MDQGTVVLSNGQDPAATAVLVGMLKPRTADVGLARNWLQWQNWQDEEMDKP
jgi:hypothetical protein